MGTRRLSLSSTRSLVGLLALVSAVAVGCDTLNPISFVGAISLTPQSTVLDSLGDTVRFTAIVRDRNGVTIPQPVLEWLSTEPSVATVDGTGLAVAVGVGTTTITAFSGAVFGSAALEVLLDPITGNHVTGDMYDGRVERRP